MCPNVLHSLRVSIEWSSNSVISEVQSIGSNPSSDTCYVTLGNLFNFNHQPSHRLNGDNKVTVLKIKHVRTLEEQHLI